MGQDGAEASMGVSIASWEACRRVDLRPYVSLDVSVIDK